MRQVEDRGIEGMDETRSMGSKEKWFFRKGGCEGKNLAGKRRGRETDM